MSETYSSLFDTQSSPSYRWDNPGVLYDRFGHSVDTSGDVWELTDPTRTRFCDWRRAYGAIENVEAVKSYLAHCIETKAPHTVGNAFYFLIEDEKNIILDNYPLSVGDFVFLLERFRDNGEEWKFHWVRKWYVWCADVELPGFSQGICEELLSYTIEGNEKGVAVLTDDDEEGPLDNVEYELLRSVVKNGIGSDLDRVCVMLCMELGTNPKNIVLLEERDFVKEETDSGQCLYSLRVPRVKKRLSRRSVRARSISRHLGRAIERLLAINEAAYGRPFDEKCPILRRSRKRHLPTKLLKRFQFHLATPDFSRIVIDY